MGFFSDLINGKQKTQKADPLAGDINNVGKSGLNDIRSGADRLRGVYSQDPSNVVNSQIGIENKLLRGAADDASRRTRELIAQRGLGNSSIGLGEQVQQERQLNDKLALNTASGVERLRNMQLENAQGLMQAGQGQFNIKQSQGPIQMQDLNYRTGGYGQLIGALSQGAGAYFGGR